MSESVSACPGSLGGQLPSPEGRFLGPSCACTTVQASEVLSAPIYKEGRPCGQQLPGIPAIHGTSFFIDGFRGFCALRAEGTQEAPKEIVEGRSCYSKLWRKRDYRSQEESTNRFLRSKRGLPATDGKAQAANGQSGSESASLYKERSSKRGKESVRSGCNPTPIARISSSRSSRRCAPPAVAPEAVQRRAPRHPPPQACAPGPRGTRRGPAAPLRWPPRARVRAGE